MDQYDFKKKKPKNTSTVIKYSFFGTVEVRFSKCCRRFNFVLIFADTIGLGATRVAKCDTLRILNQRVGDWGRYSYHCVSIGTSIRF